MRTAMENKYKTIAALWAVLGGIFLIGALAAFLMRNDMPQMPRADIAYIGFLIVGLILWAIAAAVYCMANDKNAMIEEHDERSKTISEKAGGAAFLVQTVFVSAALFLLCFMGYASAPVMITLMCLIAGSVFVYLILVFYYRHTM